MNNSESRTWHITAAPAEVSAGLAGIAPVFSVAPAKWRALPLDYADACAKALTDLSSLSPGAAPSPTTLDAYAPPSEPVPQAQLAAPADWELILLVDTGPSMSAWYPTVNRFVACAYELPLFRHVRVVTIDPAPGGCPQWQSEVEALGLNARNTRSRKIVFIITDGVSSTWKRPELWQCMQQWAQHYPLAVLHVLPYQSWHLSAIRTEPQKLRSHSAGCPNSRLLAQPSSSDPEPALLVDDASNVPAPPIPVLELRKAWLEQWVQLMVFNTQWARQQVLVVPQHLANSIAHVPAPAPAGDNQPDPSRIVAGFRTAASDTSFKLAVALAAAPLNRHVMQMVAAELLPWASPRDLSAVLTSGLLQTVATNTGQLPEWATVTFDFRPGVRQRLLEQGESVDTRKVVTLLDTHLGPVVDAVQGVSQRIQSPSADRFPKVSDETLPFLTVECDVLAAIGTPDSPHREAADLLTERIAAHRAASLTAASDPQG
ncbi:MULTISPECIES: SAV_2336 N-terminal domain-related protein [Streptomyces]|uniref:SAV_2336 N-terminal domain-related protein n=1 Tax=Streptomyces TaxID=1883 RepID=UPI0027BA8CF0|nr:MULTISPECIES: SAV_2336 N-terminal domain-related protein [unclassified Streptomyces]